jgi:dTDP-glucose 4,6-dehydratase
MTARDALPLGRDGGRATVGEDGMPGYLVTGGCGFIGSNFVRHLLRERPGATVVNLDALTYAGNPENLADLERDPRYRFVHGSVTDPPAVARAFEGGPAFVVHFAAESHVDRSLTDAAGFLETNVIGTQILIDAALKARPRRFLQVSTDEVYGSLGPTGLFTEETPLAPSSPYAASKAAADLVVRAAHHASGLPAVITRSSNNFGPYQFPEKLIPLFLTNAMEDRPLPVYGTGTNVRDWIYVEDNCAGILAALERGRDGEAYNIGGGQELPNLEVTRAILKATGKPESLVRYVTDRPGHDFRYALDTDKARRELGWAPRIGFAEGIARTAAWYRDHRSWWERVKSGAYREYYQAQYGARLA